MHCKAWSAFCCQSGDQLAIAKETGRRLGMGINMYPSLLLLGERKDEFLAAQPVGELIEKADGFAGVFPGDPCLYLYSWSTLLLLLSEELIPGKTCLSNT